MDRLATLYRKCTKEILPKYSLICFLSFKALTCYQQLTNATQTQQYFIFLYVTFSDDMQHVYIFCSFSFMLSLEFYLRNGKSTILRNKIRGITNLVIFSKISADFGIRRPKTSFPRAKEFPQLRRDHLDSSGSSNIKKYHYYTMPCG